MTQIGNLCTYL
ncbi:hypothetical protein RDI58_011521 [Solanum bulbocastanum]|uniref:Uncharacterized protein n=1 Tax=Solanum bulbocastanum TaxID=147425 RepID=A0AAN8TR94_SOLBU